MPLHFSNKDFEILDLDPPNNPTSHYGVCHFGYNLALIYPSLLHPAVSGLEKYPQIALCKYLMFMLHFVRRNNICVLLFLK